MDTQEKWLDIQEILLRTLCTDDSEFKTAVLKHNMGVSEEAKRLHAEAAVLDCSITGLENYNWMTEASGITGLCAIVPDVYNPNAGAAIKNLANLHWAVHRCPASLCLVDSAEEILLAKRSGRIGVIAAAQHADFMLHRDLAGAAEVFSMAGFRVVRIAGDASSFLAGGSLAGADAGLTGQGRVFLKAMEKNGITVDLAGASQRSFFEALALLRKPVVCSSSGIAALSPHPYNLTDRQIRAIADNGGVVCLSADPRLLWNGRDLPTIGRYVDAVAYAVSLVGIDAVGIGTGLCGQPGGRERHGVLCMLEHPVGACNPHAALPYLAMYNAGWGVESASVLGLGSIANLPNLTEHLLQRGFSHAAIHKILGENLLRVFRATWPQPAV